MFHKSNIPFGLKSQEELDFFRKYDVLKCVFWIMYNKFQKVCLQFPDELLKDSVSVCSMIEERVQQKLYILADTTFGSCCVDYIAAKHVEADAIVHFGHACLSSNYEIPTLYVFPKEKLNVFETTDTIITFAKACTGRVIVLYDISYAHYVDEFSSDFAKARDKVRLSWLAVPQQKIDHVRYTISDVVITKFERYYSLPDSEKSDNITYICLAPLHRRQHFENIVLSEQNASCYRYCPEKQNIIEQIKLPEVLKRRLYEVEKVKEAKRVGILVSTMSTDKYMDAVERVKALCKLRKKNSYIFSVGKVNVEKLANFPEIDVFVLIGCPEAEIENKRDFYCPIVGMMEVEMALNKSNVWWQNIIKDYREFLPGGSQYKEINEEEVKNVGVEADISLISSTVVANLSCATDTDVEDRAIMARDPLTIAERNANYDFSEISFKGLQPNIGNTPVEKASIGRKGTPSGGYEHPSSKKLS